MTKKNRSGDHFLRIGSGLYNTEAFRTLPAPALKLWVDLRTQFRGGNNGRLVVTLSQLARRGWTSKGTLQRARDHLLARGLIRCTKYCGPNVYHRASMFAFTDIETQRYEHQDIPGAAASHEYKAWTKDSVIYGPPQKGRIGPQRKGDTTLAEGERISGTVPVGGERRIFPKAAPTLAFRPKADQLARSLAGGDTSSSTSHSYLKAAGLCPPCRQSSPPSSPPWEAA